MEDKNDGWLLTATQVAAELGISKCEIYSLGKRFPCFRGRPMLGAKARTRRARDEAEAWARREFGPAAIERWRREAAEERARLFGPAPETEEERARRERYEREAQATAERARRSYRARKQQAKKRGLPGAQPKRPKRRDIRKGARAGR